MRDGWFGSRFAGRALAVCCGLAVGTALLPTAVRADDDQPPPPLFASGRLLATQGVSQIEGAAGGGLAPWAVIAGYGTADSFGANVHGTVVRLPNFTLGTTGAAVGIADRLELSYAHQWFDTGTTGRALGLGQGFTFAQDVAGAKLRLFGDAVYDQDRWWPQVALGLQY